MKQKRIKNQRRKKNNKYKAMICCCVIFLFGIAYIGFALHHTSKSYRVIAAMEKKDNHDTVYQNFKGKILKYNRDGIALLDKQGKKVWNQSYQMKEPRMEIQGQYIAVADIGGTQVYLLNAKGKAVRTEVALPILQVTVAKQGVIALLLQGENYNNISVYYPMDTVRPLRYEMKIAHEKNGFPLEISLAPSGEKMATSYVNVSEGKVENTLNFYNFNVSDAESADNLIGFFRYHKMIAAKTYFFDDSFACAVGEKSIAFYSVKGKPRLLVKRDFDEIIRSISCRANGIAIVLENAGKGEQYKILQYDKKGRKVFEKTWDDLYEKIQLEQTQLLLYGNGSYSSIRKNGTVKFQLAIPEEIAYIMPTKNIREYLLCSDKKIEQIRLKK